MPALAHVPHLHYNYDTCPPSPGKRPMAFTSGGEMNLLFLCCGDVLQFVEYMFVYASCLHLHHLSYAVKTKLSFLIAILEMSSWV